MSFSDIELSRRLERAEGEAGRNFAVARQRLTPGSAAAWMEAGGAIAIFDGVDSPVTQTFGLGLFEEVSPASLDEIERFFRERGAPVVHEVSPFAGIAAMDLLCARGYRPIELSSVMHQSVAPLNVDRKESVQVRIIGAEEAALWADISARGWAADYPEMQETIRDFGLQAFARPETLSFLAEIDGRPGAAGSLCLYKGVALFGGASTIPELRLRGLQSALLAARMQYASEHGYDLAMMVTAVGSQSQRNAERIGFKIAYTRTKWRLESSEQT